MGREEEQKVVDEYLKRCRIAGDKGAYHQLITDRDLLRITTLDFFARGDNGCKREKDDLEGISRLLSICESTLYTFLENLSRRERLFGWPIYHEDELRKQINTALQIA